jgi:hypothetical protein
MPTIHLRINDGATGQPTPVRLRVTTEAGGHFAPLGRTLEFPTGRGELPGGLHLRLGRERWCTIDGSCEITLPAGVPLRVQATKGPEYRPVDELVTLKPGQMTLRYVIDRVNHAPAGFRSCDGHAEFLTPHAAAIEAAAEGLDAVQLLAFDFPAAALDGQTYHHLPNLEAFSGQTPALTAPAAVTVNTLNTHPVLGRVALLHAHRPVYPLTFGGANGTDDWSLSDWCDQARRKRGYPVWSDPLQVNSGVFGGEALIALLHGKIEAIELDGRPRKQPLLPLWYKLLNAGFRVQLVGCSRKDSSLIPLGAMRTYAAGNWLDGVRSGNSFVTNGPLLTFVNAAGNWVTRASSLMPFGTLDIVADGVAVASAKPTERGGVWQAEVSTDTGEAGWVAARAGGGEAFAHYAPQFSGKPSPRPDLSVFRKGVESTIDWVNEVGRYEDAKFRDQLLGEAAAALAKLGDR